MTTKPRSSTPQPLSPRALARLSVAAIALLLVACQSPAAVPSGSNPPIAVGNGAPSATPGTGAGPSSDPSPDPSAGAPSPSPTSTPTPTATPPSAPAPKVWSKPVTIAGLDGCSALVVAIDGRGTDHLAATCTNAAGTGSELRYAVSTNGRAWTTRVFATPTNRFELDPQLAVVGNTLYFAYTRVAPTDGGCGDDGLQDVGVYYRTRSLPDGLWSAPTRIGAVADHLDSFRVSGSVLHATVFNEKTGSIAYETVNAGALRRYPIGDAVGGASLRIGDDGRARIAYESSRGIAYGMVRGGRFTSSPIPKGTNGWAAQLVLAPGNDGYLLWNRSYHGAGCVGPDPEPLDGTYFATNASGTWVSTRLTTLVGGMSLTIDPAHRDLHALVGDFRRLVYFHRAPGGTWTHETLVRGEVSGGVIRENPKNGTLLVVYVDDASQGEQPTTVEVIVRS